MSFLHGGLLLAGGIAAAIPILIHLLFRRRRPPLDWAAMDILLAALRRQERRLRLEQLVLLALRCLLFLAAGAALSQPLLKAAGVVRSGEGRAVAVVLDDGVIGMTRDEGEAGASSLERESTFDRLKRESAAFIRGLSPGDSVGLVLTSRPARAAVVPPTSDREAVARAIEALEPSEAASDLSEALRIANESIASATSPERVILVASEFRLGTLDPTKASPSLSSRDGRPGTKLIALPPAKDDRADIAITSVDAQRSVDDDSISVVVRLERSGGANAAGSARVSLKGDGTAPIPPKIVRFDAGQAIAKVEFSLRATNDAIAASGRVGNGAIEARIDGDAMPANDVRFAVFDARSATRIGIVARRGFGAGAEIEQVPAARWIARALSPVDQPGIEVNEVDPFSIDAAHLRDMDVLILPRPELLDPKLWPEIRRFADRGGFVLLMPSSEASAQRWVEPFVSAFELPWTIEGETSEITPALTFAADQPARAQVQVSFASVQAELSELLRPVDVSRRVVVTGAAPAEELLRLSDGTPFLVLASPGSGETSGRKEPASRGFVALFAVAPELAWTNLPVKPLMVPLFQELVRTTLARIGGAERALVSERPFVAVRDARQLVGPGGRRVALDGSGLAESPLAAAGAWSVEDSAGRVMGGIPVNVEYAATRMTPHTPEIVAGWFAPAGAVSFGGAEELVAGLSKAPEAIGIGVWLLALALAIALFETLVARWFSHAAKASGSRLDPGVTSAALADEDRTRAKARRLEEVPA